MRTLLRTTLITMLVVFSGLVVWSLVRNANTAQSAQAAPEISIPEHCVTDMNERLAKAQSPGEHQAAIQAELQCAADAQGYAARKGTALAKVTPPTSMPAPIPGPTATIQVGIQKADLGPVPQSNFMPTENDNNWWADFVNGQVVQIAAGYIDDPNWQDHPKWAIQGALSVTLNYDWPNSKEYLTPSRHGIVHFIAACGAKLILQAKDGTTFTFDAVTLAYVDSAPACPTVTP